MNKRFTYYWHDYMDCQVVVDNQTTEEYPIEDNRVKDPKYDNNGIEYLVNKMNEQEQRIQELEEENEQLKQQLNMDKTSITSFALYQVAKRFFGKDDFEILNKSHDGIGVYKIIIKKPKSDVLMSIFLDDLKRTFNFLDGTQLIISCEIELFKGLF